MRTLIFVVTLLVAGPAWANQCGIKPITPVGCSDMICVCDQNGFNCKWYCIGQ